MGFKKTHFFYIYNLEPKAQVTLKRAGRFREKATWVIVRCLKSSPSDDCHSNDEEDGNCKIWAKTRRQKKMMMMMRNMVQIHDEQRNIQMTVSHRNTHTNYWSDSDLLQGWIKRPDSDRLQAWIKRPDWPTPGLNKEARLWPTPGLNKEARLWPTPGLNKEARLWPTPGFNKETRLWPTPDFNKDAAFNSCRLCVWLGI